MNVFVLCTGRCGSTTFYKACRHISNLTAGHETLATRFGPARFAYPEDHIEVDNRLSWQLGHMHKLFGDDAFYVHLTRDREATAMSFLGRFDHSVSIVSAFARSIRITIQDKISAKKRLAACYDYIDVVTANIETFLLNKSNTMSIQIENASIQFPEFWQWVGAEGDLKAALKEFNVHHNSSSGRRSG